jgi:phosphoribosylformylglycinamidine synthase subunit PurQ / glutaminase
MKPKAYVLYGLGIGCDKESAHAYKLAGADPEIVHIRNLTTGSISDRRNLLFKSQILNMSGGFLQGDKLGAGMCEANEIEHSGAKESLLEYVEKGGVIYAQCNGFQLLVKTGLLPGINDDYSKQTLTLTHNDCGIYRNSFILHKIDNISKPNHFAFDGLREKPFYIWCRHGEGKVLFYSRYGSVPNEEGELNRKMTNDNHVILRYIHPETNAPTDQFPFSPNGSVDAIAGLANSNGRIFGHMAHTEIGVNKTRDPRWFFEKDELRRRGVKAEDLDEKMLEDTCLKIFRNIVDYVK